MLIIKTKMCAFFAHSKADKTFVVSVAELVVDLEKEYMKSTMKYARDTFLCEIKHAIGETSDAKKNKKIRVEEDNKKSLSSLNGLAAELRESLAALMSSCDFVDFVEIVDNAIYKSEASLEKLKFRIDRQQWRLIKIRNKDSLHIEVEE